MKIFHSFALFYNLTLSKLYNFLQAYSYTKTTPAVKLT